MSYESLKGTVFTFGHDYEFNKKAMPLTSVVQKEKWSLMFASSFMEDNFSLFYSLISSIVQEKWLNTVLGRQF